MEINRRTFLKTVGGGIAGAVLGNILAPRKLRAGEIVSPKQFSGVLVDTTRCVGCRTCEAACAEAHHLVAPDISDQSVFEKERKTTVDQWTVVNRYQTEKGEVFVKRQCMHCSQPGCVSACLVKAMEKRKEGPVTWDTNCMGCRYCMPSCRLKFQDLNFKAPILRFRNAIYAGKD